MRAKTEVVGLRQSDKRLAETDKTKKKLANSMGSWLPVFKFPSVERGTYDWLECTAKHQHFGWRGSRRDSSSDSIRSEAKQLP